MKTVTARFMSNDCFELSGSRHLLTNSGAFAASLSTGLAMLHIVLGTFLTACLANVCTHPA